MGPQAAIIITSPKSQIGFFQKLRGMFPPVVVHLSFQSCLGFLCRLAPVLKTIFHQCVISYTCSQSNSDGSVWLQVYDDTLMKNCFKDWSQSSFCVVKYSGVTTTVNTICAHCVHPSFTIYYESTSTIILSFRSPI